MIDYIADYIQGRNTIPMASAVQNTLAQFHALGQLQDIIGWWRFLERIFLRNSGSTATDLCCQWFSDEFGQMVIWTHHTAAQDYT